MSTNENPLLSSGTDRETNQQESREQQPAQRDPMVVDAIQTLSEQYNGLREEQENLSREIQEIVDERVQEETADLRDELEDERDRRHEAERDRDELKERVDALEGDVTCTGCGGEISPEHVDTAFQEEGNESGVLGPTFTGSVESMNCPKCSETVDVTHLPDADRERITNKLKRAGVAAGEPTLSTSADQDGADVEQDDDRAEAADDQGEDQGDE